MTFKYLGQTGFGGYDRRIGAEDGAIHDMENMSAKDAPVLRTRPRRLKYKGYAEFTPQGVYGNSEELFYIEGGKLMSKGVVLGEIDDTENIQSIIPIGNKLIIFPAWYSYDIDTGEMVNMRQPIRDTYDDGRTIDYRGYNLESTHPYYGYLDVYSDELKKVFVKGNKVRYYFEVNDQYQRLEEEDTVIDVVNYDGKYLVKMLKHDFHGPGIGAQYTYNTFDFWNIRVILPEYEYVFHSDNRLWAYKDHDIKCTSLGIPTAWDDYNGLTTDSWAATVNGSDKITGAGNVNGSPTFFCENCIYKIYGNNPTEYGYTRTEALGLKEGEQRSVATGGQYIYYVSRRGICAYNGGIPTVISAPLASEHFQNAVGGSDGVRYYLSCLEDTGRPSILVFDPALGYWMREDTSQAVAFTNYHGNLIMQRTDGVIFGMGDCWPDPETEMTEDPFVFGIETSTFIDQWYAKKGANRMLITYEAEPGTKGRIYVKYDDDPFQVVSEIYPGKRHTEEIPLPANRYDKMTINITGHGEMKIWMMARNTYASSERG